MHVLFTSKESHLPVVVSENSGYYVDMVMSGMYIEEDFGSKKEMEDLATTILEELYFGNFDYGMA